MKRILLALAFACALAPAGAADITPKSPIDNGVTLRFKDMGDGSWAQVVAPGGNVAAGATDSGNPVKVGGVVKTVTVTGSSGIGLQTINTRLDLPLGARGFPIVQIGDGTGFLTATGNPIDGLAASPGLFVLNQALVFNGTTWDRSTKATTTSRIVSAAATTNATSAKATAGTIHTITGYNAAAAVRYLKIYNKATAPTVGTDTPVITIALKPSDAFSIAYPMGYYLNTGIAYALTTGAPDADTGALTLADIVGLNVNYN